jgi:predicted DCC family thiol-disulfide oxidoreductase YuxK
LKHYQNIVDNGLAIPFKMEQKMKTNASVPASLSSTAEPSLNEVNVNTACPLGPVILFDGQCNLCHSALHFIIARDFPAASPQASLGLFSFAPLQSESAKALITQCAIPQAQIDSLTSTQSGSFVLIDAGRYYLRSDAALEVARKLPGLWRYLVWLRFIPRPVRDGFYQLLGRYRYRLFGQRPLCLLPSPAIRQRLLSEKHLINQTTQSK